MQTNYSFQPKLHKKCIAHSIEVTFPVCRAPPSEVPSSQQPRSPKAVAWRGETGCRLSPSPDLAARAPRSVEGRRRRRVEGEGARAQRRRRRNRSPDPPRSGVCDEAGCAAGGEVDRAPPDAGSPIPSTASAEGATGRAPPPRSSIRCAASRVKGPPSAAGGLVGAGTGGRGRRDLPPVRHRRAEGA